MKLMSTTYSFPKKEKRWFNRFLLLPQLMLILLALLSSPWGNAEWDEMGSDIVGHPGERSGKSTTMSANGSIVAIGAVLCSLNSSSSMRPGCARVFSYRNESIGWVQMGKDIVGHQDKEYCGVSISLNADGNILALGCSNYSIPSGVNGAGRVLTFSYNGSQWVRFGNQLAGEQDSESYGISVSLNADGTMLAIGASLYDVSGTLVDVGRTLIYFFNGTMWVPMGRPILGSQAREACGTAVALNAVGNVVAMACYKYDVSPTPTDGGRVRVYSYNDTEWIQMSGDILGDEVSTETGTSLAINAYGGIVGVSSNSGTVRVFTYGGNVTGWIPLGLLLNTSQPGEYFGCSIALNGDGMILAVGACKYSLPSTSSVGRTLVYAYHNGIGWIQWDRQITGTQSNGQCGSSVSLTYDGLELVTGCKLYAPSPSSTYAGCVRVYSYLNAPTSQPTTLLSALPSSAPSGQPSGHTSSQPLNRPSVPSGQPSTKRPSTKRRLGLGRPSNGPTIQPSSRPSVPFEQPSTRPSGQPSNRPSAEPSSQPSSRPSAEPSGKPSSAPSGQPSTQPSGQPSNRPSAQPSSQPSNRPSVEPSGKPSSAPSGQPSTQPSGQPSNRPSAQPSSQPSNRPSVEPSGKPSALPSSTPSGQPSTQPSGQPSKRPSAQPSSQPSNRPSVEPSGKPSALPSSTPSGQPSTQPSGQPSKRPSAQPSSQLSNRPSVEPSGKPSSAPSGQPSTQPSGQPSNRPSAQPSSQLSNRPSVEPSGKPSALPSSTPSGQPSTQPSGQPSNRPSAQPSSQPSNRPSVEPSGNPSSAPSGQRSKRPSAQPSTQPSSQSSVRWSPLPTKSTDVGLKTTVVVKASNSSTVNMQNISGNSLTIAGLTNSSTVTVTITSLSNASSLHNKNASALASKLKSDIITVTVTNSSSTGIEFTANISTSSTGNSSSQLETFKHNCTFDVKEQVLYNCSDAEVIYNLTCSGVAAAKVEQQCPVSQLQCSVIDMNTFNVVDSNYCTVISSTKTSIECRCGYSSSNNTGKSTSPPSMSPTSTSSSVSIAVTSDYVTGDFSATVSVVGDMSSATAVKGTMAILSAFGSLWLVGLLLIGSMFFGLRNVDVFSQIWRRLLKAVEKMKLRRAKTSGVIMPLNDPPRGDGKIRSLWATYMMEILPKVYRPRLWLYRIWEELCERHEYLELFMWWMGSKRGEGEARSKTVGARMRKSHTNEEDEERWEKVSSVGKLLTAITISCFLLAWLYDLQYPDDDGSCEQYLSSATCLERKSPLDSSQSYCKWQTAAAVTAALLVESKKKSILSSTVIAASLTNAELHTQCQYSDSNPSLLATILVAVVVSFISTVVTRVMSALFSVILAPSKEIGSWWTVTLYLLGELLRVDLLQRVSRCDVTPEVRHKRQTFLTECNENGGVEVENQRMSKDGVKENLKGRTSERIERVEIDECVKKREEKSGDDDNNNITLKQPQCEQSEVVKLHQQLLHHAEDMDAKAVTLLHVYLYDILRYHGKAAMTAEILWQTVTKDYRRPPPSVSLGVKVICGCLILGVNMGALLFICLKGLSRGKVWQGNFLEACAIQWVMDVVFVSVVEILSVDFGFPGLVYGEVLEMGFVGLLSILDGTLKHLRSSQGRKECSVRVAADERRAIWFYMSESMKQLVCNEVCRDLPEARMLSLGCSQHLPQPSPDANLEEASKRNESSSSAHLIGERGMKKSLSSFQSSRRWSRKVAVAPIAADGRREGLKGRSVRPTEGVGRDEQLPGPVTDNSFCIGWAKSICSILRLFLERMTSGWYEKKEQQSLWMWLLLNMPTERQRLFVRFFAPLILAGVILAWSEMGSAGSAVVSAYKAVFVFIIVMLSVGAVWKSIRSHDSALLSYATSLREQSASSGAIGLSYDTMSPAVDQIHPLRKEREGVLNMKDTKPIMEGKVSISKQQHKEEGGVLLDDCLDRSSPLLHEEVHAHDNCGDGKEDERLISLMSNDYSSYNISRVMGEDDDYYSISSSMDEISIESSSSGSSCDSSVELNMTDRVDRF